MPDYPVSPVAAMIGYLDSERKRRQDEDNANIDSKIALIHDLISGPGANPARTAEGIQNLLELYDAKNSSKRKPTKGAGGFLGSSEIPMPTLLAGLIHGSIPYQGPTTETIQHPGFENAATTVGVPANMPGKQVMPHFTGQSILDEPVPIPPAPISTAPSGTRMLDAARQMQVTQPVANQPLRRAPEEVALEAGQAKGIEANAEAEGKRSGDLEALTNIFGPEEALQILKRNLRGANVTRDTDAGVWEQPQPDGTTKKVRAVRVAQPDGSFQTVDAITRLPLPPDAVPTNIQAEGQDPTSKKEYDAYTADEKARGNTNILGYDDWLTKDANRKRPTNTFNMVGPSGMTRQQQTAFNQIAGKYTASPLIKAAARTITMKANADAVRANPSDPAAQMALAYSFIQAADTYQSAVREGELKNINTIDSILGTWLNNIQRISSGQTVRPEIALKIARYTNVLLQAINQGARDAESIYTSQAAVNGLATQWQEFLNGAHRSYAEGTPNTTPPPGGGALPSAPPKNPYR